MHMVTTPPLPSPPPLLCPFFVQSRVDTWQLDSHLPAGTPRHVVCASRVYLPRLLLYGGARGLPVRYRHTCGGRHEDAVRVGIGYGGTSREANGGSGSEICEGEDGREGGVIEGVMIGAKGGERGT